MSRLHVGLVSDPLFESPQLVPLFAPSISLGLKMKGDARRLFSRALVILMGSLSPSPREQQLCLLLRTLIPSRWPCVRGFTWSIMEGEKEKRKNMM